MLIVCDYFGVIAMDSFWSDAQSAAETEGRIGDLRVKSAAVNKGDMTWDMFCEYVAGLTQLSVQEVRRRYDIHSVQSDVVLMLNELKNAGHTVVLLSNASSDHLYPKLRELGLSALFERVFVSSDIHLAKPDPRIFQYVLDEMRVESGAAIMIDDSPSNIAAAESVGMKGIVFTSTEECMDAITAMS
jgi:HAD superfamily hydrolase (TIGR01509 family)